MKMMTKLGVMVVLWVICTSAICTDAGKLLDRMDEEDPVLTEDIYERAEELRQTENSDSTPLDNQQQVDITFQKRDTCENMQQYYYTCIKDEVPHSTSVMNSTLHTHNQLRAEHGVSPLVWNDSLAAQAQNHSEWMACAQSLSHSTGTNYGEIIAVRSFSREFIVGTTEMIVTMYNEMITKNYNFSSPNGTSGAGHFSQIVWNDTTTLGCGISNVTVGKWHRTYLACQYTPQGNILTKFVQNVFQPTVLTSAIVGDVDIDGGCDFWVRCKRYKNKTCDQTLQRACYDTCN